MLRARMILDQELHFRTAWRLPRLLTPLCGPRIHRRGASSDNGTNPKYLQVLVPKGLDTHPASKVGTLVQTADDTPVPLGV